MSGGGGVRWVRSSSGFVTIGTVFALLATTVAMMVGVGASNLRFNLGDGFGWFASNNGQVAFVDGATGKASAKVTIPGAANGKIRVEQRDGHAYVVVDSTDGSTRVLYRLDDATLDGGGTGTTIGNHQNILRGGDKAYLVDSSKGEVVEIDPNTLEPTGAATLTFDPPIKAGADNAGRLVVLEESDARASVVDGGTTGAPVTIGNPGDQFELTVAGGIPTVVDTTSRLLVAFRDGEPKRVTIPDLPGELTVATSGDTHTVGFLLRNSGSYTLVLADLDSGSARTLPVPDTGGDLNAPLVANGAVYLVAPNAGKAYVVDPSSGRFSSAVDLGIGHGGNLESFVKDGMLWVNNPDAANAVVVDRNSNTHPVNKYDAPEIGPPAPAPTPDPPAPPAPLVPPVATPTPTPSAPVAPIGGAPGAGSNFTGQPGNSNVSLSWTAAPSPGTPLTGYTLHCTPDCGSAPEVQAGSIKLDGTSTDHIVSGLINGTAYSFDLSASNNIGAGPSVPAGPFRPTGTAPDPIAAPRVDPGDTSATVAFTTLTTAQMNGLSIDGYRVTCKPKGSGKSVSMDTTAGSATVAGLVNGVTYGCVVVALMAGTPIGATSPSSPVTPFGAPASLTVTLSRVSTGPHTLRIAVVSPQWAGLVGTVTATLGSQSYPIPTTGGTVDVVVAWDSTSTASAQACVTARPCVAGSSQQVIVAKPTFGTTGVIVTGHCQALPTGGGPGDFWQVDAIINLNGMDPSFVTNKHSDWGYGTTSITGQAWRDPAQPNVIWGGWVTNLGRHYWVDGYVTLGDLGEMHVHADGTEPGNPCV
jgi:hypothetical protein